MAFSLRVTGDAVAQTFSAPEVSLGRDPDNDIVIRDIKSSRRHARIFAQDGAHFLEDLQSHNGTVLNAAPVRRPVRLTHGDRISIGAVSIEFIAGKAAELHTQQVLTAVKVAAPVPIKIPSLSPPVPSPAHAPVPPVGQPSDAETRIKPLPVLDLPPGKPVPPPSDAETRIKPLPVLDPPPGKPVPTPSALPEVDIEEAVTALRKSVPVNVPSMGPALLPTADLDGETELRPLVAVGPLPSDLAREQRALRRSRPRRVAQVIVGLLALGALLGGLLWASPVALTPVRSAPATLIPNGEPLVESFGLGDKVSFPVSGAQTFSFTAISPTKLLGILHLKSAGLSPGEVMVELNTVTVGPLPADDLRPEQESEVVLPAKLIKVGQPNTLVFDHTLNPPGADPWRVWNLWVETIPVPDVTVEQAVSTARAALSRADELSQGREVGSMNLFRAWKGYREAWLVLEATEGRPDADVKTAALAMNRHRLDLDKLCSTLLIDFEQEMAKKKPSLRKARKILRNIPNHFGKEHPCYALSLYLQKSLIEE